MGALFGITRIPAADTQRMRARFVHVVHFQTNRQPNQVNPLKDLNQHRARCSQARTRPASPSPPPRRVTISQVPSIPMIKVPEASRVQENQRKKHAQAIFLTQVLLYVVCMLYVHILHFRIFHHHYRSSSNRKYRFLVISKKRGREGLVSPHHLHHRIISNSSSAESGPSPAQQAPP